MPSVTTNAVIAPHPSSVVNLDEPPPLEDAVAPAAAAEPVPSVKEEPTTTRPAYDPEIYCGVPPLPAGWCQPDLSLPAPPPKKQRVTLPPERQPPPLPPPLISVGELAIALGVALISGLVLGGSVSYLLSKPKVVCEP
jgi:hypothetical protein